VTPPFTSRAVAGVVVWIPKLLPLLNVKFALPCKPVDVPVASNTVPEVVVPVMAPPPPPPLTDVNADPFQYILVELPGASVSVDPRPDPDVYTIEIVNVATVEFAIVQNTPGDEDVYVGRVKELNPGFVILYSAAEFVVVIMLVGVGIINDVPATVIMFARHSVGAVMQKALLGVTWMFPMVSIVRFPPDAVDGVNAAE